MTPGQGVWVREWDSRGGLGVDQGLALVLPTQASVFAFPFSCPAFLFLLVIQKEQNDLISIFNF